VVGVTGVAGVVERGVVSADVGTSGCTTGGVAFLVAVVLLLVRCAAVGRVGRVVVSDGVAAVSVVFWASAAGVELVAVEEAVRRRVAGFASCSKLSELGLLSTALSVFVRALVRLLVVVGFTCTCSFASGDSDVFLMKKTPFYR
ncbi:MAG TPA: hypothetical protein DDW33_10060, partial [Ktedonobacter sp.]|nr:hypothetical protein [Ktedonobacter sp.]